MFQFYLAFFVVVCQIIWSLITNRFDLFPNELKSHQLSLICRRVENLNKPHYGCGGGGGGGICKWPHVMTIVVQWKWRFRDLQQSPVVVVFSSFSSRSDKIGFWFILWLTAGKYVTFQLEMRNFIRALWIVGNIYNWSRSDIHHSSTRLMSGGYRRVISLW